MLGRWQGSERGDTIIEVLLAVTIFSLVSVGTMAIMNQGTNTAQRALETTLVRQQIDAQAEAIRAAHQAELSNAESELWDDLISDEGGPLNDYDGCTSTTAPARVFAVDPLTATEVTLMPMTTANAPVYASVVASPAPITSYGLWVEPSRALDTPTAPDAYDFRIRACWYGAGMDTTPMRIETNVRLYDPS